MYKKIASGSATWVILIGLAAFLQACTTPGPNPSPLGQIKKDERITYYYRDPQPSKLILILGSALKQEDLISHPSLVTPLAHFFATAVQKDMSEFEELKALQKNYSGKARSVVKKIIAETNKYQLTSLKSPKDLELLWSEYEATGDKQIIERIFRAISLSRESNELRESARTFLIRKAPYHYEIHKMLIKKSRSTMEGEKILVDEMLNTINRSTFDPADHYLKRGLNYSNLKRYDEALEEYKKGLKHVPDHAPIYNNMGIVYANKGKYTEQESLQKAKESAKKSITIDPENYRAIFNLGLYYFYLREYSEAAKCYLKVLEYHPKNAQYHRELARAYHQTGDKENAAIYYKNSLEYGPEDRYLYAPLINHYLASFGKPVEEDPNDIAVMFQNKRFNDLEEKLVSLLREKSRDKEGHCQLYQAYHTLCDNSDFENLYWSKINYLKEWLARYPSSHFANACLGMVYINYAWHARGGGWGNTVIGAGARLFEERLLTAKEHLEKAYSLDPSDPIVPARLIAVARGLGLERGEMEEQFERALLADPKEGEAYSAKLAYLMPKWYGSKEEMFSFAREAAKKAPPDSRIPAILAEAHWEMYMRSDSKGSYFRNPAAWKEMKEVYLTLSKRFPNSTRIPNWFARTAYLAGDYDTAREELKRIGNDWLEGAWDNKKSFDEVKKELLGNQDTRNRQ